MFTSTAIASILLGAGAVAVCLLHAYVNPAHERREQGFVAGEKIRRRSPPRAEDDGDAGG